MRIPREIFYAGALLALASILGVFIGFARAYRDSLYPGPLDWLFAVAIIAWLLVVGIGLLRLRRWAALLLGVPIAILGVWMLNAGTVLLLLPLAVTVAGWRTLR